MTLRQWFCALSGHLPITKRDHGKVQRQCFLCHAGIGPGFDFSGPVPRSVESRYRLIPRFVRIEQWTETYDGGALDSTLPISTDRISA